MNNNIDNRVNNIIIFHILIYREIKDLPGGGKYEVLKEYFKEKSERYLGKAIALDEQVYSMITSTRRLKELLLFYTNKVGFDNINDVNNINYDNQTISGIHPNLSAELIKYLENIKNVSDVIYFKRIMKLKKLGINDEI